MTVAAVRHVGIVVPDMDEALGFYRDLLGLEVQADNDEHGPFVETILAMPGVRVRTVKLAAPRGEALVELLCFAGNESAAPASADLTRLGPTHAALTVEGLDGLHARLSGAGVEFLSEPQTSADGRARVAFCRAPGGALLELVEPAAS
jgi:catechol 2,3-dioxygenase-like lactoylglutathione lyase family enzyme